ncbi:unnamed protein product [Closterium sp. Naga37s-1]|nr:unnamed protein product [Closterium sp. Naga37s-1]
MKERAQGLDLASALECGVGAVQHLVVDAEGEAVVLRGAALAGEGEECPSLGMLESRGVPELNGPALEAEGEECPSVGMLESRGLLELNGPALEAEGEERPSVGMLESRVVLELNGPALEAEGEQCPLVGHQEGRGVLEQSGPALEAEGEECPSVGHQEGRGMPELDGPVLGVSMEVRRCSVLEKEIVSMLFRGPEGVPPSGTGFGGGALTTLGNPRAPPFDVNTVLRQAREWYRAEHIDTGRTTSTHGVPEGEYAEQFHPASALALPVPDCGQRGNCGAPGVDEPTWEEDPVPEDAREDADEADDGDVEPGIHVRTGF